MTVTVSDEGRTGQGRNIEGRISKKTWKTIVAVVFFSFFAGLILRNECDQTDRQE